MTGCGRRGHDEDCLCDLRPSATPAPPARNPALALVEIDEDWGTGGVTLADRLLAGRSYASVARLTGLTESDVRHRAQRLGVQSKRAQGGGLKLSAETYKVILDMHRKGATYMAIAAAVGEKRSTVYGVVRRRTAVA